MSILVIVCHLMYGYRLIYVVLVKVNVMFLWILTTINNRMNTVNP